MKAYILILFFFAGNICWAQSVNDYQYVMVPSKFDFLKKPDEFRLNTLLKLLMEKYGFKAYLDSDAVPFELVNNACSKLNANVESSGNFIRTKLVITLKDCNNKVLFTSAVGQSKEKDWGKAYNEALRQAAFSMESLHYKYILSNTKMSSEENQTVILENTFDKTESENTLFAQPIANGFQLVDNTPKIIMKIYKTSNPKTFTAVKGTTQGVLISKEKQWYFEYYLNDRLISEKTAVKF